MLKKRLRGATAFLMLLSAGILVHSPKGTTQAFAGNHYVGEHVYNVPRDAFATVVAIAYDGTYVIQFTSGPLAGQTGQGWTDPDLASTYGCLGDLCTGYPVYNNPRDAFSEIVAIAYDGTFVLEFTTGTLRGQTGHGWSRDDLAVEQGCSGDLCVGQAVYNTVRGENCTVVALQTNGQFVLYFVDGPLEGQYGHGWNRSDLTALGPYPPSPPSPYPPTPPPPPPAEFVCTLTAEGREFFGRGYDEGQAATAARDQCLRVLQSPSCDAGNIVCRRQP